MKHHLTILLVLLTMNYVDNSNLSIKISNKVLVKKPKENTVLIITDDLYDLKITIEKTKKETYNLIVLVNLKKESYYVSPNTKRDFKGKFKMNLGSYKDLSFAGKILETPLSKEIIDTHPFINGSVNWVRVKTTYKQALNLKNKNDFEVFGKIKFIIEPQCSLEEIPFTIQYKNGKMIFIDSKC